MLRFYAEVARAAFRRQLIYRWANLAGLATNIFFGAVSSYVFIALFHARPVVAGYHVRDALRYLWVVQSMIMVVLPFSWYDLMLTIRSGEVVTDLSKPCDFYWYWFSREVGRDLYYVLFRGVPAYLAGMLLFGIGTPDGWGLWLAYGVSLLLGAALGIAYRFLFNIAAFWLVEARAVAAMAGVIAFFFTGSYIPLAFFPSWLRPIAEWLPFSGLMNVPAEVFTGTLTGGSLGFELGRQTLWVLALTLAARAITRVATHRVVSQGG